jgi:deoxyribonuclease V
MKVVSTHPWEVTPAEGKRVQNELREKVSTTWEPIDVKTVAGVDVGMKGEMAKAAVVVLSYPELSPLDQSLAQVPLTMPYIPGLLAFREAPAILAAYEKLASEPDLLIFDGQGLAHPRHFGIASHVGVILDVPSIGCAKSRLWGSHHEPPHEAGSYAHLYDGEEIIGAVVRTRTGVHPVYVSIGHKIDLPTAIQFILSCCRRYRLPEPIRFAHRAAGGEKLKIEGEQKSLFDLL